MTTGNPEDLELSYSEALRVFWRIAWPAAFAGAIVWEVLIAPYTLTRSSLHKLFLVVMLVGFAVFLFLNRMVASYHGFALHIVSSSTLSAPSPLGLYERFRFWSFFFGALVVGNLLLWFAAGPLNIILSLMRIHLELPIELAGNVLVLGPLVVKMMVGRDFGGYSMNVLRSNESTSS
jgi:hypothetical protein